MSENESKLFAALADVSVENAKLRSLQTSLMRKLTNLRQFVDEILVDVSHMAEQLAAEAVRACRFAKSNLLLARQTGSRELIASAEAVEAATHSASELVANLKAYMFFMSGKEALSKIT